MKQEIQQLIDECQQLIGVAQDNIFERLSLVAFVFYHGYYASVCDAKAKGTELPLIDESLARVDARTAVEYGRLSREELLAKFSQSQQTIVNAMRKLQGNSRIPYKKTDLSTLLSNTLSRSQDT